MPTRDKVGLFDRDVLLKLACCGLWNDALAATGVTRPFRLPSCTVIASDRVLRRWFPETALREAAVARLAATIMAVPAIDEGLARSCRDTQVFLDLANTDDIDAGEAQLVAMLETSADPAVLLTGDKRFIAALRRVHPARFAALSGRILSFESCVTLVCQARGVAHVVDRVRSVAACDGTLRLALGGSGGADHGAFLEALASMDPCRG